MLIPTLEQIDGELSRRHLRDFLRCAWPHIEKERSFTTGWHIDAVCDHLDAVALRHIKRLVINVPPRTTKSTIVQVCYPAHRWIKNPETQFLCISHTDRLVIRDGQKMRLLIEKPWYQGLKDADWQIRQGQDQKQKFENTLGGYRLSMGVGAGVLGEGGDEILIDDPLDRDQAFSETERLNVLESYDQKISTRLNSPKDGAIVLIMQRLHEEDLSGHVLSKNGWEHLMLPMEFDSTRKCFTSIGFEDPRTVDGELLCEERFPPEILTAMKIDLGSVGTAGQLQQEPAPAEGIIFKKKDWRFWYPRGTTPPPAVQVRLADNSIVSCVQREIPADDEFEESIQSWDCAFKDKKDNDKVAGGLWSRVKKEAYLRDRVNENLSFTKTCQAIEHWSDTWPDAHRKLVEDKANGSAVIDTLREKVPGLKEVNPQGGKESRAHAIQPYQESGNIYLPHPALFPWVEDYVTQHGMFPNASYDDEVDQTTQAILFLLVKNRRQVEWTLH